MGLIVNLNDPAIIENFSSELFDQERFSLKEESAKEFTQLYENKWIGLPQFCHRLAGEWAQSDDFMNNFTTKLEKAMTLEEATEITMNFMKIWGKQVVAEFVGAICMLEAKLKSNGQSINIIEEIRNNERSYGGYLKILAAEIGVKKDEPFGLIQPINENASGFFQWMLGVIDISLLNRRELIKEALVSEEFDQIILKLLVSTKDVFEDASLLCGFIAVKLELEKFYT